MESQLITARQVSDYLGMSVHWVLDKFEEGTLPGFKLGRSVRFRLSEVEDWLEGCRRGSVEFDSGPKADL